MSETRLGEFGGCSRRQFVGGLSALGASLLFRAQKSAAQASSRGRRIDVHHHFGSPTWVKADTVGGGNNPWRQWSPARALEAMDQGGVATAMLSVTTPGVWLEDRKFQNLKAAVALARENNEYAARLASDHKGRFGAFVATPLPNVDAALREIEYGLDTLKFDGVGVMTSYGDRWLGDPSFTPVLEELNRRKAVLYVHPTAANCCYELVPQINASTIEYGTDTTRTIMALLVSGAAERFPDMRFIFSHAGGTMPFLIPRIIGRNMKVGPDGLISLSASDPARETGPERLALLRRFFYDTAQQANPVALGALRKVVPASQIVFGSDYPYATMLEHATGVRECGVFKPAEVEAIEYGNAQKMFPKFKT
jgi:predicted TIM-barrel fold metal-dependent hydrolase